MRLLVRAVGLLAVLALCAAAQPTIASGGILNGASFAPAGLPNGSIAQGSIFSIFGTSLGPAAGAIAQNWPLTTNLGGAMVHVTAGATTVDAILLYTGATQINAIMPSTVPVGTATVMVEYPQGQSSAPATITVVKSSPGLFAMNQKGNGPAALQNFVSAISTPLNTLGNSAHQGDTVILWGTGLGGVNYDESQQPPAGGTDLRATDNVLVLVAGRTVTPDFAGRTGYVGLDQINFTLPADIATGCYIPVEVVANNVYSNSTSMSIVPGDAGSVTCSDSIAGLPADLGKDLRAGAIVLSSTTLDVDGYGLTTESGSGMFDKLTPAQLTTRHGQFGVSTYGACSVYTFFGDQASYLEAGTAVGLDAGPQLNLTLPDNSTKTMPQSATSVGEYSLPSTGGLSGTFLIPGLYTLDNGSGGADVKSFTATLNVPDVLRWENMSSINIVRRSAGQTVTWSVGDQNSQDDMVVILGMAMLADSSGGAGFYCLARASDQQFTVPAEVLMRLPAVPDPTAARLGIGEYSALSKSTVQNLLQGLDTLQFGYSFTSMKGVAYQ